MYVTPYGYPYLTDVSFLGYPVLKCLKKDLKPERAKDCFDSSSNECFMLCFYVNISTTRRLNNPVDWNCFGKVFVDTIGCRFLLY